MTVTITKFNGEIIEIIYEDEHTANFKEAVENAVGKKISLASADLDGMVLHDAALSGGDFANASFRNAILYGADISGATLCNADLTKACMREVDLSGADLAFSNLRGADLRNADLRSANLSGAKLRGADLRNADLSSTNLRGADLCGSDLRDAILYYADSSGANFNGAYLIEADLSRANLNTANLSDAVLNRATLRNAKLVRANLCGADLEGADLSYANLSCADLRSANFTDAVLNGADTTGAITDKPEKPILTDNEGKKRYLRITIGYIEDVDPYYYDAEKEPPRHYKYKMGHSIKCYTGFPFDSEEEPLHEVARRLKVALEELLSDENREGDTIDVIDGTMSADFVDDQVCMWNDHDKGFISEDGSMHLYDTVGVSSCDFTAIEKQQALGLIRGNWTTYELLGGNSIEERRDYDTIYNDQTYGKWNINLRPPITIDKVIFVNGFFNNQGIRDKNLIDSAIGNYLNLPEMEFLDREISLFYSIMMNHPFVDGNKRTALLILELALLARNIRIVMEDKYSEQLYHAIVDNCMNTQLSHDERKVAFKKALLELFPHLK